VVRHTGVTVTYYPLLAILAGFNDVIMLAVVSPSRLIAGHAFFLYFTDASLACHDSPYILGVLVVVDNFAPTYASF
jgi:hypothetical protein